MLRVSRKSGAVAVILMLSTSTGSSYRRRLDDLAGSADARFPWDAASDTDYGFSSGSTWPRGWKNAIRAAHGHWNDARGSTLFVDLTSERFFDGTDCSNNFHGEEIVRRVIVLALIGTVRDDDLSPSPRRPAHPS